MELKNLSPVFAVTGQITADDMAAIAERGIRTVICNRPDGEGADQPDSSQLAAAAARHGIAFEYIPVIPGQASDADAMRLARILKETEGPALGYCRSGVRAESLWRRATELSGD
jgi:sulfide:quinone oxidoreductase